MPILLLLAGVVILAGVVGVAMGRGGEMAEFAADYLPPDVMTAADVAMLRPPASLWGYNAQLTDEALSRIAQVISERDVEIAVLRQQLAALRSATGSHPAITATLLARSRAAAARGATAAAGSVAAARTDSARTDSVRTDSVRTDGARTDGESVDPRPAASGSADAGPANAGPVDSGTVGSGAVDSGPVDPGTVDAGTAPRSQEAAASRDD